MSVVTKRRRVRFADVHTVIEFDRCDSKALSSLLSFDTEMEKAVFFRSSLNKVCGKAGNYNPAIFGPKWEYVCGCIARGEIADDIHDLISEAWPWIQPPGPGGRWQLSQIEALCRLN